MKQYQFREQCPKRTFKGHFKNYRRYKDELAKDFNHHCGYTHCCDKYFGGIKTFQIDHFKPCSFYPQLKNEYNNLVYCCSSVNRLKSNDDNSNYLDPCSEDYNIHFGRRHDGRIYGKTKEGEYMVRKLSLNLSLYAIFWNLERLDLRISLLEQKEKDNPELCEITNKCFRLFRSYLNRASGLL